MSGLERRDRIALVSAVALAILAYAHSVANEFVYDDVKIIIENRQMQDLGNWRDILVSTWWPNALYRPLSKITLAIDWAVSGGNPHYFHAVNVVLHGVATGLVFLFVRGGLSLLGATVATLVFAVHPVHVEAVANVVGRAEVLATLFAVAAALLYRWDGALAGQADVSWRRWVASFGTLGCLLLGVAAKESALAIPGILLIVDWFDARRAEEPFPQRVRRHQVLWFGAVALAAAWMLLRSLIIGDVVGDRSSPGLYGEGLLGRTFVMAPVILHYVRLFFFPLHLSADYSPDYLPAIPRLTVAGAVGFAVLVGCIALAVRASRRAPYVTFAWMWVGGTLLVVSNLIVPSGVILAERSMYMPSVGVAMLFGWLAQHYAARRRTAVMVLAATVIVLGTVRTAIRVPVWRDAATFFPRLVQDAPGSFRGMWLAGMLWYNLGDRAQGENLLRNAIATYPMFANTWFDLAGRLQEDERWEEAATAFGVAFRLDDQRLGDAASAVTNYVRAGMLDSATAIIERARAIDPHHPRVQLAMADIAMGRGRPLEAMTWRRQASLQSPDAIGYWFLTADAALRAEYCPEAMRSIARVRGLDPEYAPLSELEERAETLGCTPTDRIAP